VYVQAYSNVKFCSLGCFLGSDDWTFHGTYSYGIGFFFLRTSLLWRRYSPTYHFQGI